MEARISKQQEPQEMLLQRPHYEWGRAGAIRRLMPLPVLLQLGSAPEEGGEVVVEDARLLSLVQSGRVKAQVCAHFDPKVNP